MSLFNYISPTYIVAAAAAAAVVLVVSSLCCPNKNSDVIKTIRTKIK